MAGRGEGGMLPREGAAKGWRAPVAGEMPRSATEPLRRRGPGPLRVGVLGADDRGEHRAGTRMLLTRGREQPALVQAGTRAAARGTPGSDVMAETGPGSWREGPQAVVEACPLSLSRQYLGIAEPPAGVDTQLQASRAPQRMHQASAAAATCRGATVGMAREVPLRQQPRKLGSADWLRGQAGKAATSLSRTTRSEGRIPLSRSRSTDSRTDATDEDLRTFLEEVQKLSCREPAKRGRKPGQQQPQQQLQQQRGSASAAAPHASHPVITGNPMSPPPEFHSPLSPSALQYLRSAAPAAVEESQHQGSSAQPAAQQASARRSPGRGACLGKARKVPLRHEPRKLSNTDWLQGQAGKAPARLFWGTRSEGMIPLARSRSTERLTDTTDDDLEELLKEVPRLPGREPFHQGCKLEQQQRQLQPRISAAAVAVAPSGNLGGPMPGWRRGISGGIVMRGLEGSCLGNQHGGHLTEGQAGKTTVTGIQPGSTAGMAKAEGRKLPRARSRSAGSQGDMGPAENPECKDMRRFLSERGTQGTQGREHGGTEPAGGPRERSVGVNSTPILEAPSVPRCARSGLQRSGRIPLARSCSTDGCDSSDPGDVEDLRKEIARRRCGDVRKEQGGSGAQALPRGLSLAGPGLTWEQKRELMLGSKHGSRAFLRSVSEQTARVKSVSFRPEMDSVGIVEELEAAEGAEVAEVPTRGAARIRPRSRSCHVRDESRKGLRTPEFSGVAPEASLEDGAVVPPAVEDDVCADVDEPPTWEEKRMAMLGSKNGSRSWMRSASVANPEVLRNSPGSGDLGTGTPAPGARLKEANEVDGGAQGVAPRLAGKEIPRCMSLPAPTWEERRQAMLGSKNGSRNWGRLRQQNSPVGTAPEPRLCATPETREDGRDDLCEYSRIAEAKRGEGGTITEEEDGQRECVERSPTCSTPLPGIPEGPGVMVHHSEGGIRTDADGSRELEGLAVEPVQGPRRAVVMFPREKSWEEKRADVLGTRHGSFRKAQVS